MFNTDLCIKIKDSLPAISESILDFFCKWNFEGYYAAKLSSNIPWA